MMEGSDQEESSSLEATSANCELCMIVSFYCVGLVIGSCWHVVLVAADGIIDCRALFTMQELCVTGVRGVAV